MPKLGLVFVALAASVLGAELQDGGESLAFSAEIVGQEYCLGVAYGVSSKNFKTTPDTIRMRMHVRVSYRNVGAVPLIFGLDSQRRTVLSLDDAAERRHEEIVNIYSYPMPVRPAWQWVDRRTLINRPARIFPVVPPGQSVPLLPHEEAEEIQVYNPAARGSFANLLGKRVLVRFQLTDNLDPKLARYLRAKWQRYGRLWTGEIRTPPVEIDIPQYPEAHACESLFRID